jgi:hypothetical protein
MSPPMKVYRISKEKLDALRPSLMARLATVLTISIGASVFISFAALGKGADIRLVLVAGLWLSSVFTYAVFKASRKAQAQMDDIAETYELALDSTHVTRRLRNLADLTIDCSAIQGIEEHGTKGLIIRGDSKVRCIGVSPALENYGQLKAELVSFTGLEIQRKSGFTGADIRRSDSAGRLDGD